MITLRPYQRKNNELIISSTYTDISFYSFGDLSKDHEELKKLIFFNKNVEDLNALKKDINFTDNNLNRRIKIYDACKKILDQIESLLLDTDLEKFLNKNELTISYYIAFLAKSYLLNLPFHLIIEDEKGNLFSNIYFSTTKYDNFNIYAKNFTYKRRKNFNSTIKKIIREYEKLQYLSNNISSMDDAYYIYDILKSKSSDYVKYLIEL